MTFSRLSGALLAVVLSVVATGLAVTGTASAHQTSYLSLAIVSAEGPVEVVTLECAPTGGTHPNAKAACADLTTADGDLNQVGDDQLVACTMEYRPVTASARGHWEGKLVTWEQEYPNNCTLTTDTGTVFHF
jgi:hypothetical protein